jgi:lauroyl/myristoyl acyltransferase
MASHHLASSLKVATYRGLGRLLQAAPEPVADGLATVAGQLGARLWRSSKGSGIRSNLAQVVGDGLDDRGLDRLVARAFDSYAHYWVQAARVSTLSLEELDARFSIEGFDELERAAGEGRGVIIALPHMGTWEFGGSWIARNGYPLTTVGEVLEPRELFDYFVEERARICLTVLPLAPHTTSLLLGRLRAGGVVALLADRDLTGSGVAVEFFGKTTTLPGGPGVLALRSGAALLAGAAYQEPGGRHRAVLRHPVDTSPNLGFRKDVARITQLVAHELEALITAAPEQWHCFQPNWPAEASER